MAWPAVLAAVGIGLQLIGGMQARSDARRQAAAQRDYEIDKANVDRLNADLIELQGEYNYVLSQVNAANLRETAGHVLELGEMQSDLVYQASLIEAERILRNGQKVLGQQVVNYGKSGVTLEGTPTEFIAHTAGEIALDALIVEYGGRVSQWEVLANTRLQADQMFKQADVMELAGEFDLDISKFRAGITRSYADLTEQYAGKAFQQATSAANTNFLFDTAGTIIQAGRMFGNQTLGSNVPTVSS